MGKQVKAVGLLSGGLDSTLAAKLLQDQGIEVLGLNLYTGFCVTETKRRTGAYARGTYKPNEALKSGGDIDVPVDIVDIAAEGYFDVIKNPKYGRGANVNPCIDCRIFMFHRAKKYMEEVGADFVFTGEVLGQRPMSQHRQAMKTIEKQSGLEGLLMRPLSAKLMEPTQPELDGRVDRERLKGFNGRSRRPQMELAAELGLEDWAQPAGGCCYLTDANFARKFRDVFDHNPEKDLLKRDVNLLTLGRHFRLGPHLKFIVGRHEGENDALVREAGSDTLLTTDPLPGPTTLVEGAATPDELTFIARVTARYSDHQDQPVDVKVRGPKGESILTVDPLPADEVEAFRI